MYVNPFATTTFNFFVVFFTLCSQIMHRKGERIYTKGENSGKKRESWQKITEGKNGAKEQERDHVINDLHQEPNALENSLSFF